MKSKDKTAECINGKFYYIVPEEEYVHGQKAEIHASMGDS